MIPVHVPIPKTASRSIAVLGRELGQTGLHEPASVLAARHPGALLWTSLRHPDDWHRSWYGHLARGGLWSVLDAFGGRSWSDVRAGLEGPEPAGLYPDALWRPDWAQPLDVPGLYSRMLIWYLDAPVVVVPWAAVPAFVATHYGRPMPREE